jgi:PAS domain S-box-containing protein
VTQLDITQVALLGEAADCLEGVAVFVWDDDRRYVTVNDAACRIVGRSRDELLGMRVGDMTPDRASPLFDEMVRHHGPRSGTLRFDGGELHFVTAQTKIAGLPYWVSVCWSAA